MSTIKNIILKTIPLLLTTIIGDSMSPTFTSGEIWFTVPVLNRLKVGDVVVAEIDNKLVVKRIANIEVVNKRFTVPYSDNINKHNSKVFLLGDNKEHSIDSRNYGAVCYNCIVRKVWKPSFFTRVVRRLRSEKAK